MVGVGEGGREKGGVGEEEEGMRGRGKNGRGGEKGEGGGWSKLLTENRGKSRCAWGLCV